MDSILRLTPRQRAELYQEMFFGRPLSWAEIVERLRKLEAVINRGGGKT